MTVDCPCCGEPITAVTTVGLAEHHSQPCGCRIAEAPPALDGGGSHK